MQISPSAALFQALSSLSQPQGAQAHGAAAAPLGKQAKQAAEAQIAQAVPAAQGAEAGFEFGEPTDGETPDRGALLDISA